MKTLRAEQIKTWQGRLIDVREPFEYAAERIEQMQNIPLDQLAVHAGQWDKDEPILLMCQKGNRSRQGAEILASAGFADVASVEGGIEACKSAGLPVIVNRRTIPMMRQVLIGAGVLVLIGLVLAHVHPNLIVVSWVVAVAMVVAGVTGVCPMMEILRRMPWNRVDASPCSTGACPINK